MKTIEFKAELKGKGELRIPREIASQLPRHGKAKVILLLDDDDDTWRRAAYEGFLREDVADDSVYDKYA